MAKPLVIVFARAPRYGAVKTRLAREIGPSAALQFYRHTLFSLVRRLRRDGRFDVALAVTPDAARAGWPAGIAITGQGRGDLGQRMVQALRNAGPGPAAVIGSDIPEITATHIRAAFTAMGRAPFALGPARDGGYWLIGARHPLALARDALGGVRWSTQHTMRDTIARLGDVAVLDAALDDIDDAAGYRRYVSRSI
jgi:rSAM/selenodomain-associated transferase 1